MILAEKIAEERKKNGWSQEELAERVGVSRQAVSKWESAGAVPDLQKVLQLAELFGVSTDYLLKDEINPEAMYVEESCDNASGSLKKVSMEDANEFLGLKREGSKIVANATSLCIISPVLLIVLGSLAEGHRFPITEALAAGVGCAVLLVMVAIAVFGFITYGIRVSHMEHLEKDNFETEYGVSGMVRERRKVYEPVFTRGIAIGVVLCILSVIPLILAGVVEAPDDICGILLGLLLFLIAVGVNLIIRVSTVKESYDTLLQEGEFSKEEKLLKKKTEALSGAYWCLATAIYLGWSFTTRQWEFTWIIWPVAGVLYAAVMGIVKMVMESGKEIK